MNRHLGRSEVCSLDVSGVDDDRNGGTLSCAVLANHGSHVLHTWKNETPVWRNREIIATARSLWKQKQERIK